MSKDISDIEFERRFPDERSCHTFLFDIYYKDKLCKKCRGSKKFYPVVKRRCFECGKCGHQVYPANKTVAKNSKVPIKTWFKAIYFLTQDKNSMNAMHLSRHIEVSYKTALNMFHKIMHQLDEPLNFRLTGTVEIDETWIGGKRGQKYRKRKCNEEAKADEEIAKAISDKKPEPEQKKKSVRNPVGYNGQENKTMVLGILQRKGLVKTIIIKNKDWEYLQPLIQRHISKDSIIYTDEYPVYEKLPESGYSHKVVHHSKYRWAYGKISTNGIEGYWSRIKNSIRGSNRSVSKKYLHLYLQKFDFIHNRRTLGTRLVFEDVLFRFIHPPEPLLDKQSSSIRSNRFIGSSGP